MDNKTLLLKIKMHEGRKFCKIILQILINCRKLKLSNNINWMSTNNKTL